jgi:flagellar basal body-associated protein FliL
MMADKAPKPEPTPPKDTESAEPAPRRFAGVFVIVKAIAFLSIIVVVEVVAASMLIPSAQDTERLAQQYVAAGEGHSAPTGTSESETDSAGGPVEDIDELEMGTFNVTHFNPATNTTLSIDFELFGAVLAKDAPEFQELFEKNKIRVREQVIMIVHAADAAELSDAGLGLIKRQILEKTNRALGQPLLHEVLFSKFNFVER